MDWKKLKKSFEENKFTRYTHIVAVMPQHPPVKLMTGYSEGIEPIRMNQEYWDNQLFLQKQKENQEFKEKLEQLLPNKNIKKINKRKL